MDKQTAPFGSWKSPVSSDEISSATLRLGQTAYDGGNFYWSEGRPAEGGRQVIVRRAADGRIEDAIPQGFNARTLVHEYGGGAFTVKGGKLFFANYVDQRIYLIEGSQPPRPVTPESKWRYADFVVDEQRQRLIAVREDHSSSDQEAVNTLVSIPYDGISPQTILTDGDNFYSNPRISPDGKLLAWLSWNHPNMPWDGTELWVGELHGDGTLGERRVVAGGHHESIFQPEWGQDGTLFFVSDRSNWWNPYALKDPMHVHEPVCIAAMDNDFGLPMWQFAMNTYVCLADGSLLCSYSHRGVWQLARLRLDFESSRFTLHPLDCPYTDFGYFATDGTRVVMNAGSPTESTAIVELNTASGELGVWRRSSEFTLEEQYICAPETIEFETDYGRSAYMFFYPPKNPHYEAPHGQLPPLILKVHGGPTGCASSVLNPSIQFWTSRGFAVADVNYSGSTGFGRAYRERLNHWWGVVDVSDCQHAARHLAHHHRIDDKRKAISGGSAGGYTVLCALTFGEIFQAGASHFGIGDLVALQLDTHKFEARYGDHLTGAWPQEIEKYRERSPINFVDRLSVPIIFFQGLEDKAVPKEQAEKMVEAMRQRRIPVAYIAYPGEQHGFRQAKNIKRTLDAELYFYSRVFAFPLADEIEPVVIENLEEAATTGAA